MIPCVSVLFEVFTLPSGYIKYILRTGRPLCKTRGLKPPILRSGRKKTPPAWRFYQKRQTEGGLLCREQVPLISVGGGSPFYKRRVKTAACPTQWAADQSCEATSRATSIMSVNLFWRSSGVVASPVTRESETVKIPRALTSAWGLTGISVSGSKPSAA